MASKKVFWFVLAASLAALVPQAQAQGGGTLPSFGHVVIVVGENNDYLTTYDSSQSHMPYLTNLANTYGLGVNYYGDTHPSIGNYFALTAGQILTNHDSYVPGSAMSCSDSSSVACASGGHGYQTVDNIAHQMEATYGITSWKAYAECLPNVGYTGGDTTCPDLKTKFFIRHVPLAYFTNISTSTNLVPYESTSVGFSHDLSNNNLPKFSFITPNGCDDGHDYCSNGNVTPGCSDLAHCANQFDTWLNTNIGPLLSSSYFQPGGDGLLIIVFDEDSGSGCSGLFTTGTGCGGRVEIVVVSPSPTGKQNYQSQGGSTPNMPADSYQEENVLKTIAQGLNVSSSNLGSAATAAPMSDFFNAPPTLSLSSLTFADQNVNTTSAAKTDTLTNPGSTALSISSIAITGTNGGDFAQTNNCGTSLAAGASCTINVTFRPTTTGARTATLTITDSANNSPQTAMLTGTGINPAASLSTTSLTFASQTVGMTSAAQIITLSSTGSTALSISSITIAGTNSGDFAQTNNCSGSVAAGASCTFNVTFTPTATGTRTGTLTVTDNASSSPQTASLTGTGVSGTCSGPTFVQVQNNVDTGTTAHTSFFVNISTNPGNLLVAFVRESSNGTDNFTVTDSAVQAWVQVGSYKNESSTGPRIGMFYVANSAALTRVTANYITAGGVVKPGIMVYEISGAAASAVLDNWATHASGASVTTSSSDLLSTTNANDILVFATDTANNETGWTVGPGYTIPNNNVSIGPSGSDARMAMQYQVVASQQSNATTTMTYTNAAWNGNIFAAFKASCSGGSAVASLSTSSLTFASQPVGTTSPAQPVTLSNTGTATLSISSISVTGTNSGDFAQTNNCGTSVAAGANCAINVTFTPTATGTRTASLSVADNASGSPQSVSLTGTVLAFAQVQNNIDVSGAAFSSLSVPITTSSGDLLVAFVRESSNGTDNFTVTDSAGNTWTQTASGYKNESSTGPRIGMFYVANSAGVTSVTAHYTTSGGVIKPGVMVMEISGAAASGVLDSSVTNASLASVTTSSSPSPSGGLTTTNTNDILVFATDTAGNETGWTAGAGYTIPNNNLAVGASGSNIRQAMQYQVVSSIQTNTATSMTYVNAAWNGNIFAAFK